MSDAFQIDIRHVKHFHFDVCSAEWLHNLLDHERRMCRLVDLGCSLRLEVANGGSWPSVGFVYANWSTTNAIEIYVTKPIQKYGSLNAL